MLRRVALYRRAKDDLKRIYEWYEEQQQGLSADFKAEVFRAIDWLAQHATRNPNYYRRLRRVLLRRFPYKMFYRVYPDRVVVVRVLHAHRDHTRLL